METIKEQWKELFRNIHYNTLLKRHMIKLKLLRINKLKESKKRIEEIKIINKSQIENIGIIESVRRNAADDKNIFLHAKPMFKPKFNIIFITTILKNLFKFDGYIIYCGKGNIFTIYKIKNLSMIYNLMSKKETYALHKKVGTMNHKPVFFIKYPVTISLNIKYNKDLYYEPKAFFNYVNKATNINLLNVEDKAGISGFLKKNIIIIIIVIIVAIFLSTPQGQKILSDLAQNFNPS